MTTDLKWGPVNLVLEWSQSGLVFINVFHRLRFILNKHFRFPVLISFVSTIVYSSEEYFDVIRSVPS